MQLSEFIRYHRRALERDEVRHNLLLGILSKAEAGRHHGLLTWTLGAPGHCAIKCTGRAIVLGEVCEADCHELAQTTKDLDYPAVLGPDYTATWFVEEATKQGIQFDEPIPQQIHALSDRPKYPGAPGLARPVVGDVAKIFVDWMLAFHQEALPYDPVPTRSDLETIAGEGRHWFWIVDGEPVSMAGIARRTRCVAAIAPVDTSLSHRGRGYGGSITTAVVERVFAEGKNVACLYTDQRNPFSNRCYAIAGFKPICASRFYVRQSK